MKGKVSNRKHLNLKTSKDAENNFQQYPVYPASYDICSKYHEDEKDEFYSLEEEIKKFRNRLIKKNNLANSVGIN